MPAIAQGVRELKMVTIWPKTLPGLQSGAERVAEAITSLSGGRLNVKVFAAGQLVGAFESFDAVSSGLADSTTPRKSPGPGTPPHSRTFATFRSASRHRKSTRGSITAEGRRCGTS
jgi:TRAP-type C4-dicarboxylate transport system substrate-binding protein